MNKNRILRTVVASVMALSVVYANSIAPISQSSIVVSAEEVQNAGSIGDVNNLIDGYGDTGVTINLTNDIIGDIRIPSGQTVTINLNGHSITSNNNSPLIVNEGNLTIKGTGNVSKSGENCYVVDNEGTMTIENGTFTNTSISASLVHNNGTMTINNGTFTNGIIAVKNEDNHSITINGGKFTATTSGGSALQNWGIATVNGGTFEAPSDSFAVLVVTYKDGPTANLEVTPNSTVVINGNIQAKQYGVSDTTPMPTITINSGTIKGSVVSGDVNDSLGEIIIKGGHVEGDVAIAKPSSNDVRSKLDIIGGIFDETPSGFINDASLGISYTSNGDTTYIIGTNSEIVDYLESQTVSSDDKVGVISTSDNGNETLDLSNVKGMEEVEVTNETDEVVTVIMPKTEMYLGGTKDIDEGIAESDNIKAVVIENGKIVAKGMGNATVTVTSTDGKLIEEYPIRVTTDVLTITTKDISNLVVGKSQQIETSGGKSPLTYTSENKSIATVDENGKVTGKSAGSTTITVKDDLGQTAKVTVTVVAKLTLSPASGSVIVNGTCQIKANNTIKSYQSKDTSIATVSSNGTITGKSKGKTTITVTDIYGQTANFTITVNNPTFTLNTTTITIKGKEQYTIKGSNSIKSCTSNNTKVATVTNTGVITGVANGTATITVTDIYGQTATLTVKVNSPAFSLTPSSATINVGGTCTIKGSNTIKSYKSNNEAVATVSSNGTITGKSKGKTTITVTDIYGQTANFTITVNNPKFSLTSSSATINVGGTYTIKGSNAIKSYKSNNEAVATVSSTGVITGKSKGTATITVTDIYGQTANFTITVNNPKFSLTSSSATINVGGTYTIKGSNAIKSCKSNNEAVATGSNNGVITGKSNGIATITVTDIYGQTATFTITVKNTVSGKNIDLTVGDTQKISLDGGTATSSNTGVATIDGNGNIKAIAKGTATITVVSADKTLTTTYQVSVKNPKFSLTSSSATINVKETYSIKGTNTIKSCKSDNTAIATVTASGVITGVSNGIATITVTDIYGQTATFKVTVKKSTTGKNISLVVGNTRTVSINGGTATSSNTGVATIDSTGKITAVAKGTATITVVSADKTLTTTYQVTVTNPTFKISPTSGSVNVRGTYNIKGTNTIKSCKSNDTSIATVTNNGVITGVSRGKTTITVTDIYGQTATFTITVTDKYGSLIADLLSLKKQILGIVPKNVAEYDYDGNGRIDIMDLIELKHQILTR